MTRHHPKDTTLADFAAGTLNEGASLVIATHLMMCEECRGFVAALEEVGGQMLDKVEPVAMSEGASSLTAARLVAARDEIKRRAANAEPSMAFTK
jgi:putative transcriptional regulator